ncbi:uncharacterized protein JCM15063_004174 [Sporobolomyces koalae]|uniref:uncharacterized protein n=1 Tax=Sporobolomyces koalae TaxID=500713 RepID=UPI00317419F6
MTDCDHDHRTFSSLSRDPQHPYSVWDSPCPTSIDARGRLALITPELVKQAASEEIRTGKRFSLDLSIENGGFTLFGRKQAEHTVKRIDKNAATKAEAEQNHERWFPKHDDLLHINTQSSTQWDGPYHVSYPDSGYFYGGATVEDVEAGNVGRGMAAWADAGGIVGRGVLIDYARWARQNGVKYDPCLESHAVPLDVIREIATQQGVTFRRGDIFISRTGYQTRFEELKADNKLEKIGGTYAGIEQGDHVLKFLWDEGFAAVAGDQPAFEAWPATPEKLLHPVLLSGWMMPIGELLSLDELAAHCEREQRWTFFFSAMPLKVEKGLASTGQNMAIF